MFITWIVCKYIHMPKLTRWYILFMHFLYTSYTSINLVKKMGSDYLGGPASKTPCSQGRVPRFDPYQGTKRFLMQLLRHSIAILIN